MKLDARNKDLDLKIKALSDGMFILPKQEAEVRELALSISEKKAAKFLEILSQGAVQVELDSEVGSSTSGAEGSAEDIALAKAQESFAKDPSKSFEQHLLDHAPKN